MKKRKDECLVCGSRKCNHRIFSVNGGSWSYDEISCQSHSAELYEDAGKYQGLKCYFETTLTVKRGDKFIVKGG
jgi:hypothetical protein